MFNPIHLRTLAEVVRTGSFAEAARNLGYTSSAVSQQIASLERTARLPLFDRDAHSVRATVTAQFLTQRSEELLDLFSALKHDMERISSGELGRLRLGSFPTGSARLVPRSLASLTRSHPSLDILLDEAEPDTLVQNLLSGELDVAIVYEYDLVPRRWPAGLVATPLLDEDLLILLPAQHAKVGTHLDLSELRDETWIASRENTAGATCLMRNCAAEGFTPDIAYRSNDYAVLRNLVACGLGVALVPALGYEATPDVRAVRFDGARRHVSALYRSSNPSNAIDAVLVALKRVAKDIELEKSLLPELPG